LVQNRLSNQKDFINNKVKVMKSWMEISFISKWEEIKRPKNESLIS